jgi:hypothetical protein
MLLQTQLILGAAASLAFWALLRWVPLFREVMALIAFAAAILAIASITSSRGLDPDPTTLWGRLSAPILSYPHFSLGFALATAVVLAVLHISRVR